MHGTIIIGIILVFAVLSIVLIGVLLALFIFKSEKNKKIKASLEGDKIEQMLRDGKVSTTEADELKKAVGAYPLFEEKAFVSDKHIPILGTLFIISGCLKFVILAGIIPLTIYKDLPFIVPTGIIIFSLIISLIPILSGVYLLKRNPVARYITIAFSVIILFNIPVGTALGIYGLWVLIFRENASFYFKGDINVKNDGWNVASKTMFFIVTFQYIFLAFIIAITKSGFLTMFKELKTELPNVIFILSTPTLVCLSVIGIIIVLNAIKEKYIKNNVMKFRLNCYVLVFGIIAFILYLLACFLPMIHLVESLGS